MTASRELPPPPVFRGAKLSLWGHRILVVYVEPRIMRDVEASQLLVVAFHARHRRTIVLATLDDRGVPVYFGPENIARTIARLPYDALPWASFHYKRPVTMLPIPDPCDDRQTLTLLPLEHSTRRERPCSRS